MDRYRKAQILKDRMARYAYSKLGDDAPEENERVPFDQLSDPQRTDWRNVAQSWMQHFDSMIETKRRWPPPIELSENPDWLIWKDAFDAANEGLWTDRQRQMDTASSR